jgi:hypothetical protein
MKLLKSLSEGLFDEPKRKIDKTNLDHIARLPERQRAATFKELSNAQFRKLSKKQQLRFEQYNDKWEKVWEAFQKLEDRYPDDTFMGYNWTQRKRGFEEYEFRGTRDHISATIVFARKNSAAEKQVKKMIRNHNQYDRLRRIAALYDVFDKEEKRRARTLRRESNLAADTPFEEWAKSTKKSRKRKIPRLLPVHSSKPARNENPAAYPGAKEKYVGHPAHFPRWKGDWKRRLLSINDMLTRNGKSGLQMMYSSRMGGGSKYFNFFIIGADGDFVWRKYQTSPQNGQNWVYINGKKMNTSILDDMTPKKQDKLISKI